jgi:hypothetical protein
MARYQLRTLCQSRVSFKRVCEINFIREHGEVEVLKKAKKANKKISSVKIQQQRSEKKQSSIIVTLITALLGGACAIGGFLTLYHKGYLDFEFTKVKGEKKITIVKKNVYRDSSGNVIDEKTYLANQEKKLKQRAEKVKDKPQVKTTLSTIKKPITLVQNSNTLSVAKPLLNLNIASGTLKPFYKQRDKPLPGIMLSELTSPDFSLIIWVKPFKLNSTTMNPIHVLGSSNFSLKFANEGIIIGNYNNQLSHLCNVEIKVWVMVGFSYKEGKVKFYINGVLVEQKNITWPYDFKKWHLASDKDNTPSMQFYGMLDNLNIYQGILEDEVFKNTYESFSESLLAEKEIVEKKEDDKKILAKKKLDKMQITKDLSIATVEHNFELKHTGILKKGAMVIYDSPHTLHGLPKEIEDLKLKIIKSHGPRQRIHIEKEGYFFILTGTTSMWPIEKGYREIGEAYCQKDKLQLKIFMKHMTPCSLFYRNEGKVGTIYAFHDAIE